MTIVNGGLINTGGGGTSSSSQLALSDGLACFTGSFSGVTTTQISHGLNSTNLVVEFKDSAGNLLIPDTWSIVNSNVISADFSPAATGNATIIACIESGLAPITGGVTTVEGLSGIVDLDSPNGSITISTSGQVINLNALFTAASGALLQQHSVDLVTLSGLIGTGGGGGVASINNISGIVTLTSTNNGLEIGVNGQSIEFTTLFTYTSGQIIDQHSQDLLELSGIATQNTTDIVSLSGTVDGVDERLIALSGLTDGLPRTQTSINGLSGVTQLTSPDESILIGDNGQAIELSGLFTQASGAILEQKCRDVDTLSGIAVSNSGVLEQHLDSRLWQGVVSGIELSINSTNSGLYDVTEGVAYVSGIRLVMPAQSGLDPQFLEGSGTGCGLQTAFIALNVSGQFSSSIDAVHSHEEQAYLIDLGMITAYDPASPNSGLIELAHTERYEILDFDRNRISWGEFAVGAIVSSGLITSDAGSLTLATSEGIIYDRHQNHQLHEAHQPLEWFELFSDADGTSHIQGSVVTTVRNNVYDDGTGLVAINGNRFVTHSLWFDIVRDIHFMVISSDQYDSLQIAQDAPVDPGCIIDFANIIPVAKIVIRRNATVIGGDTGRIIDARPIIGGRTSQGTLVTTATTLQQAYDNSATTEITVDFERGALTIANDVVPLCTEGLKTFEVTDNAKEVEYFGVCASGFVTPSGHIRGALRIAMDPIGPARCSLDVSGLICASGLEIVHERPTLSGIGLATLADVFDAGQTSINGISGVVTLTSPDSTVGITVNGQDIELTNITSGLCSVHEFTPSDGTVFAVNHNLNTEHFTWSLWRTDVDPNITMFGNIASSGVNHAVVELATPVSGKIVLQGCGMSGITVGDTIATRSVSSHYTATGLDGAILVDASSGPVTVTIPNPSGSQGKSLYVKKIDSSSTVVTLNANGSGLIDGGNTAEVILQYDALRVTAHDGNWWIL